MEQHLQPSGSSKNTMSNQFPVMLAWTFLGSVLLGLLQTRRWKAIVISVVLVWGMQLSLADIDLLTTGSTEAYAWFAFLSLGVGFPTLVASAIGVDMGALLLSLFRPAETEDGEIPDESGAESSG